MKIMKDEGFGEIRVAMIGEHGPESIIFHRDMGLNFGDVVEARITAYHPVLKGYFALSGDKAVFLPTSEKMTEGQAVRVKITKEARWDKDAVGQITTEKSVPFMVEGEPISIAEMDEIVEEALQPNVPFGNGSMLHIERTKVCWVIDVDSGKSTASLGQINQDAIPEILRQIRLKNMGGLILVDFAGTKRAGVKRELEKQIRAQLATDPLARLAGWTPAGLLEIERKRERAELWLACSDKNPINTYYRVRRAIAACRSGNPKVLVDPIVLKLLQQAGVRARLEPIFDRPTSYFEIVED